MLYEVITFFDFIEIENGVLYRVGEQVNSQRQLIGQDFGVKTAVFSTGKGVENPTDRINLPSNVPRTPSFRSFEKKVLDT